MNFMRWAEQMLDSVDEQAAEKVKGLKHNLKQGSATTSAAPASSSSTGSSGTSGGPSKLFGLDRALGSLSSTLAQARASASEQTSGSGSSSHSSRTASQHSSPVAVTRTVQPEGRERSQQGETVSQSSHTAVAAAASPSLVSPPRPPSSSSLRSSPLRLSPSASPGSVSLSQPSVAFTPSPSISPAPAALSAEPSLPTASIPAASSQSTDLSAQQNQSPPPRLDYMSLLRDDDKTATNGSVPLASPVVPAVATMAATPHSASAASSSDASAANEPTSQSASVHSEPAAQYVTQSVPVPSPTSSSPAVAAPSEEPAAISPSVTTPSSFLSSPLTSSSPVQPPLVESPPAVPSLDVPATAEVAPLEVDEPAREGSSDEENAPRTEAVTATIPTGSPAEPQQKEVARQVTEANVPASASSPTEVEAVPERLSAPAIAQTTTDTLSAPAGQTSPVHSSASPSRASASPSSSSSADPSASPSRSSSAKHLPVAGAVPTAAAVALPVASASPPLPPTPALQSPSPAPAVTSALSSFFNRSSSSTSLSSAPPVAVSSSSSPSLDSLLRENSFLKNDVSELTGQVASLKSVWHESRDACSKLKHLLRTKEEHHKERFAKLQQQHDSEVQELVQQHHRQLQEVHASHQGSAVTLSDQQRLIQQLQLDHAAMMAQQEAKVVQLESQVIPDLQHKVKELEAALMEAQTSMEQQAQQHLVQILTLRSEYAAREAELDRTLSQHTASLSSFTSRSESLTQHTEEFIARIASLQRQLQAVKEDKEKVETEVRRHQARADQAMGDVDKLRSQLDTQTRQATLAANQAKLKVDSLQERITQLEGEQREIMEENNKLKQRVQAMEAQKERGGEQPGAEDNTDSSPSLPPSTPSSLDLSRQLVDLQSHVQTLTEQLLSKSSQLDSLSADRAALKLQVEKERARANQAEANGRVWKTQVELTRSSTSSGAGRSHHKAEDSDDDLEHGSSGTSLLPSSAHRSSLRVGARSHLSSSSSYGLEGARLIGLSSDHALSHAVGWLDAMVKHLTAMLRSEHNHTRRKREHEGEEGNKSCCSSLWLTVVPLSLLSSFSLLSLSRYPPARVGFGVYLVLLHLWCTFVFWHLMYEFGEETPALSAEPEASLPVLSHRPT